MTSQLIEIGRAYGVSDFSLLTAAFEAADIPLFLAGAQSHSVIPNFAVAMGGAQICVFSHDRDAAIHLLNSLDFRHELALPMWLKILCVTVSLLLSVVPIHFTGVFPRFHSVVEQVGDRTPEDI
ncbi:MAG: hypothetical protein ABF285_00610 [Pacificibacter sp.]|uniref:hypothetical protein n=1 Tax=Pacificibacter sp. TaxID=1917866 RepID=UPI00321953AE